MQQRLQPTPSISWHSCELERGQSRPAIAVGAGCKVGPPSASCCAAKAPTDVGAPAAPFHRIPLAHDRQKKPLPPARAIGRIFACSAASSSSTESKKKLPWGPQLQRGLTRRRRWTASVRAVQPASSVHGGQRRRERMRTLCTHAHVRTCTGLVSYTAGGGAHHLPLVQTCLLGTTRAGGGGWGAHGRENVPRCMRQGLFSAPDRVRLRQTQFGLGARHSPPP